MQILTDYYEQAFSKSENGNIYKPFSLLERLSHERKMLLLSQLPMPDLKCATVVDYGLGAWGFGCAFPQLKQCRKAIGIDISNTAIELSRKRSGCDPALKHAALEFHTSSGYEIPLPDQSIDVFFAGECIEHIEETDAFLSEVQRILKRGGVAIFTTPNRSPFIYRVVNLEWCLGYEHVALMDSSEFLGYLRKYFDVTVTKGFNQTLHPAIDHLLDEASAKNWVDSCEDDIANATGMIAMVRKATKKTNEGSTVLVAEHDGSVACGGNFRDVPLVENFKGRMIDSGGCLFVEIPQEAIRCHIIFFAHPWSGGAQIFVDDHKVGEIDLYAHVGGVRRFSLESVKGGKKLTVRATGSKRAASQGCEVIFIRCVFGCRKHQGKGLEE